MNKIFKFVGSTTDNQHLETHRSKSHQPGEMEGIFSRGRISYIGRQARVRQCRFAGSQRLPRTRTYRSDKKDDRCGIIQSLCSRVKKYDYGSMKKEYAGRVSEGNAIRDSVPPQRTRIRIMPSSLAVVVAFACLMLDPRGPRQVLAAECVRPHPGPLQGNVKKAVEHIEEAELRKR